MHLAVAGFLVLGRAAVQPWVCPVGLTRRYPQSIIDRRLLLAAVNLANQLPACFRHGQSGVSAPDLAFLAWE